ncbi:MAG: nucleotidyltransferase domain-containing protein [Anaerolineae bacterium]|nr:nucleotidyltransferase domain-containing protein [Anaerolineae bacterium]
MENSSVTIQQLKHRLVAWIATQPNLRAILVVGSQARRDHPADEWSDLDLMVFATDFSPYLTQTDWLDDSAPSGCVCHNRPAPVILSCSSCLKGVIKWTLSSIP